MLIPPPGDLNLVESDIIPPEGCTGHTHHHDPEPFLDGPDLVAAAAVAEFELGNFDPPRFDEPAPLQLERRGLTQQTSPSLPESRPPGSQAEFWTAQTAHKFSVAAKLREAGMIEEAETLEHCHSEFTYTRCRDCGRVGKFPNRCDRFYCPECQPRLSHNRREAVEWWVLRISQPKHVVLTVKNTPDLTTGHIVQIKKWFTLLRRRKFAANWVGGFYALEVTNEGRGWHLHIHALVDARYIDGGELARQWHSVTNGAGHIVKVKDARGKSYLAEVTKYAAKGSQIAAWSPNHVAEFVRAFTGQRTFGVFGDLYGKRTEFAEWLAEIRDKKPRCTCGSDDIAYYTEAEWITEGGTSNVGAARPPPRSDPAQLYMFDPHLSPAEAGA